jgi:type I restriction enzyme, S subunit
MFPEGWKIVPLASIAQIRTGIAKSSQRKFTDPVQMPYLRVANVQDGYLDLSEMKSIIIGRSEITRYLLHDGDVLLTEGGDFDKLGRGTIWKSEIPECLHQNHVFVVRTHQDILLPNFLSALTGSAYGRSYFLKCSKQSTNLASINSSQLSGFPVLLPPISEQHAIINILSTWDRAIDLTAQLIAAKQQYKRGLMQQLLTGKRRFPAFQQQKWLDASFGQIFHTKYVRNTGSHIKNPITVGKYAIRPQNEHFNRIVASDNLENYNIIEQDDFVYDPMSAYYGAFGRYELDEPGIVSPVYRVLQINHNYDSDFMKHFIKSHYIAYQLSAHSSQGNREGKRRTIQAEAFDSISFKIPDIDEQRAIAQVLNACDQELSLLNRKLELLKKQKQGLMQQLLTGKVRVKV